MKKFFIVLFAALPFTFFAQSGKALRPLFDKKSIGEIRITLNEKNWVDALDSLRIYGAGMLQGIATIDGVRYEGTGVRFRGDKSYQRGLKRNPLTIKLNHLDADKNHQGHTTLKLSNALRDPSMVREMLFHEIASKYIPTSQTSFSKLFINDEYIGIFINIESIDKQFLESNFAFSKGAFFKAGVDYKPENIPSTCKQNINGSLEYEDNVDCYKGNFEINSAGGWADLQELTRILSQDPSKIDKILDVDRTLWMLALNNIMVNLNSYSGGQSINYYLYKDQTGHFQPVLWDLNLSFGSYKNTGTGSDLELKDLQQLDPLLHDNNPYKPLISQLLKEPLYKKIYLAHIRQILEEHFLNNSYEKRALELQGLIAIPYSEDQHKSYNMDDFKKSIRETVGKKSKIPGLVELMAKRSQYLKKHPELTALPSSVSDISVQSRARLDNTKINAFRISAKADRFPKRMWIYYRFNEKDAYTPMLMPEESGTDKPSGVKSFSMNIDAKSADAVLDYYILTENAGTVSYTPQGYTKQPTKVKLSDLNK